jgi:hypothetical protein
MMMMARKGEERKRQTSLVNLDKMMTEEIGGVQKTLELEGRYMVANERGSGWREAPCGQVNGARCAYSRRNKTELGNRIRGCRDGDYAEW